MNVTDGSTGLHDGASEGTIAPEALVCEECRGLIMPGDTVMCMDGYVRVYGEYVLTGDEPHDDENWPSAHLACVPGAVG